MIQKRSISPPAAPATRQITVDNFLGIDTVHSPDEISPLRAADLRNVIRTQIGEFGKRPGVKLVDAKLRDKIMNEIGYAKNEREITDEITDMYYLRNHLVFMTGNEANGYKMYCDKSNDGDTAAKEVVRNIKVNVGGEYEYQSVIFKSKKPIHVAGARQLCILDPSGIYALSYDTVGFPYHTQAAFYSEKIKTGTNDAGNHYWYEVTYASTAMFENAGIKTPLCVIGGRPSTGGGTTNEQVNLLSPYIQESFCVTSEDVDENGLCRRFQLSTVGQTIVKKENESYVVQDSVPTDSSRTSCLGCSIRVEILKAVEESAPTGSAQDDLKGRRVQWVGLTLTDKDYFNNKNGGVWIHAGIGVSPIEGEDNVRITYLRNRAEVLNDVAKIQNASSVALYGIGGYRDRAFFANGRKIYYSNVDAPLTVGAKNYIEVGLSGHKDISTIGALENNLAVLCDDGAYLVGGTVGDDSGAFSQDAIFTVSSKLTAPPPIGEGGIVTFGGERCYLSERGIVALMDRDVTEERYAQIRSELINGELLKEDLANCRITVWDDFLLIAAPSGKIYVLDEKQPAASSGEPYSTRQYEGYIWDGIQVSLFAMGGAGLRFCNGKEVKTLVPGQLYDEISAKGERTAIDARWITPAIDASDFKRRKLITRYGLSAGCSDMSVEISYRKNDGEWQTLRPYDNKLRKFSYSDLIYDQFVYQSYPLLTLSGKARIKKTYTTQFMFRNNRLSEDLRLHSFGFDYVQEN